MVRFFFKLSKSSFLRVAGKVGLLTFIGNIVGILLLPLISRYFTQDEFGLFALFFNLSNIFIPFITLGLNDAFISVREEDELNLLLGSSLICVAVISPVVCTIIFVLIYFNFFGYGNLPLWSILFFFAELVLVSLIMVFQSWSVRKEAYRSIGISNFFLGVLKPTSQILFGLNGFGFLGLLFSEIFARLVCLFVFLKKFRFSVFSTVKKARPLVTTVIKKHKIFLSRVPSTFIFNLGTALPTLLITNEYGLQSAGYFTFMMTLLIIPSAFVQKVLGDVFIGFFFQKLQKGQKTAILFFKKFLLMLICIALSLSGLLYLFADKLFTVFFGNQWQASASMLILYIPYFIGDFSVAPFGTILNMRNKPHYKLVFDLVRMAGFFISAISVSFFSSSVNMLVLSFSVTGLFSYFIYLLLIFRSLGVTNFSLTSFDKDNLRISR